MELQNYSFVIWLCPAFPAWLHRHRRGQFLLQAYYRWVPSGFNPAHGLEKYAEEGRERFLSIEELERLGAAIREAETVGFAWAVDESNPQSTCQKRTAKRPLGHMPLVRFGSCSSWVAAFGKFFT